MDSILLYSIESFPPLRESINKINALCTRGEIDLKALARVIESDPILYTDILADILTILKRRDKHGSN
jgi:HD-like signal output (HDOD) protein